MPLSVYYCAACGEPDAIEDDGPFRLVAGLAVCSVLCEYRATVDGLGELDGAERVTALREALGEGAPIEVVALEVLFRGSRCDFQGTFAGSVVDDDGDAVVLEGEPFGEVSIAWEWVTDAREVSS